ncbi:ATP-binding cassette domain-containing protein [Candidatus Uhrbacteria bacterium]|nr:ATP-binding cassette domain-containing protein [Candidatus Uhrbacteria bacterium]
MKSGGKPEIDIHFSTKEKLRAYARFLKIIWRFNKPLAVFRFSIIFLGAFLQPLEVYFFSLFIAAIAEGQTEKALSLLIVVIISYGFRYLVNELTWSQADDWFMKVAQAATQQEIWRTVAKLKPEALSEAEVRRSLDFVREDLWRLNRLAGNTEWFMRSGLKFIAALGLAVTAPWWVSVLVLGDALLQALNLRNEAKQDIWTSTWNTFDGRRIEYTRFVFLELKYFLQLRLLGGEKSFLKKFVKANSNIIKRFRKIAMVSMRNRTLLAIFHIGAYATVIIIMGQRAIADPAQLAVLYVALNLFSLMGDALNGISGSITTVFADMQILAYINRLMNKTPEKTTGLTIPKEKLIIEFKNVSYKYPGAKNYALRNLNLTLREGEHIAIVGENGAGKTTFLRLLSGLDQPDSGQILLNNKPLDSYIPAKWRQAFHLMMQDALLYQDFVKDNLYYGTDKPKDADFHYEQSQYIAGSNAVIKSLPEKEKTFIGNWVAPPGITPHEVSGGEAQRLLISRTLIHGGRIIGFDEPTAAMDAIAEMKFFERILKASGSRGLIFISHRFSTVRRAERILLFEDGKLANQGTHDKLMADGGKYAALYNEQARWYH